MQKIGFVKFILLHVLCLSVCLFSPLCFSEPAGNKTWEYYAKSQGGSVYYYNIANSNKSSNVKSVWSYKTITDDERKEKIESLKKHTSEESIKYQDYDYSISMLEIDCIKKLNKVKEILYYDHKGKVINQDIKNSAWEHIAPNSVGEILHKKICATENKSSIQPAINYKNNWIQYGRIIQGSVYLYDKNSIKQKAKNVVHVWRKLIYSHAHKERDIQKLVKSGRYTRGQLENLAYDLTLHEIDCRNNFSRLTSIICYDASGNILLQRSNDNAKWKKIVLKSQEDYLQKQICK